MVVWVSLLETHILCVHSTHSVAMRAPVGTAAYAALLLLHSAVLVYSYLEDNGYHAENSYQEEEAIDDTEANATCPSDRLLRSRETCRVDGADVQCIRMHCCENYVYISGRCIPSSVDPCSLQLCEQACEVRGERVWCTCHPGYRFHTENYRRNTQPFCVDVDECKNSNGGCQHQCVNDPGTYHCECPPPYTLASDGRKCEHPVPIAIPEPLPLIRASSRCYAPCDTVAWLSRKVKMLSDQLHTTQSALKRIMENPLLKGEGGDNFADGTNTYRVLDATAPLEGGYCRCERGPRGPVGAPGMEGPKGDMGPRGPRGARGPTGSLDLMLLLLADIRHDVQNLESRVYQDGEKPERFNLQKAWRRQRKQERLEKESKTEQELEAYTAPPIRGPEGPVQIKPHGLYGEIPHDSETTTDWTLVKGDPEPSEVPFEISQDMDEKLRQFHLLANTTNPGDDEEDTDYDYSFY